MIKFRPTETALLAPTTATICEWQSFVSVCAATISCLFASGLLTPADQSQLCTWSIMTTETFNLGYTQVLVEHTGRPPLLLRHISSSLLPLAPQHQTGNSSWINPWGSCNEALLYKWVCVLTQVGVCTRLTCRITNTHTGLRRLWERACGCCLSYERMKRERGERARNRDRGQAVKTFIHAYI